MSARAAVLEDQPVFHWLEKGEKLKDGVAFFAVRSGAKVLPCGIKGGTKEHRKVTITYGKPLDYSQYKGSKDKEVLEKITNEIMQNILDLAKEEN